MLYQSKALKYYLSKYPYIRSFRYFYFCYFCPFLYSSEDIRTMKYHILNCVATKKFTKIKTRHKSKPVFRNQNQTRQPDIRARWFDLPFQNTPEEQSSFFLKWQISQSWKESRVTDAWMHLHPPCGSSPLAGEFHLLSPLESSTYAFTFCHGKQGNV